PVQSELVLLPTAQNLRWLQGCLGALPFRTELRSFREMARLSGLVSSPNDLLLLLPSGDSISPLRLDESSGFRFSNLFSVFRFTPAWQVGSRSLQKSGLSSSRRAPKCRGRFQPCSGVRKDSPSCLPVSVPRY